jgi:hypothetical protein
MADSVRESAPMRLLRAMNDLGAKGRTDVNVGLEPEVLARAELPLDSDILDPAMEWLLREGALRPNYAMDAVAGRVRGGRRYGIHFNITEHGFDLLNIHPNV